MPHISETPDRLVAELGSFWDGYHGDTLPAFLLAARARGDRHAEDRFYELLGCLARRTTPHLRRRRWWPLEIHEAERGRRPHRYGDGLLHGTGYAYGAPADPLAASYPLPEGLAGVGAICDAPKAAQTVLTPGIDFQVEDRTLVFDGRRDPFGDSRFVPRGDVGTRTIAIWLRDTLWQRRDVRHQYGYVLGLPHRDAARYPDLVNAVYDAAVGGTAWRQLHDIFAAALDAPLALGDETVASILRHRGLLWVVTDRNAYRYAGVCEPLVVVGDVLRPGQALTDAVRFHEFALGDAPTWVPGWVVSPSLLGDDYFGPLTFPNVETPLEVSEDGDGGYTEARFAVGGWPQDVETFWTAVHARGVGAGRTLAMALDTRGSGASGQPRAATLPPTANPLTIAARDVLASHAAAAVVRCDATGPDACGLGALADALRTALPPHGLLLVVQVVTASGARTQPTGSTSATVAAVVADGTAVRRAASVQHGTTSGGCVAA